MSPRILPLALWLSIGWLGMACAHATIPGLANAPGRNGTFFVSETKLRNPGTTPAEVSFELLPFTGAAPTAGARTIAPGETLVLANTLVDLWGEGERAGALRVDANAELDITTRTFNNADPTGTFGQALEAIPDGEALAAGETAQLGWVTESTDPTRGFRTNLGIVLTEAGSEMLAVVLGAGGEELGRRTFSGGPMATQTTVSQIAAGDLAVARIELRMIAGHGTAYTSVVDNVTGDGFAVQPTRPKSGTWVDVTLAGVARGPGRFGAYYRTDVRLVNPDPVPRRVDIDGLSLAAAGTPVTAHAVVDVPAHGTLAFDDILATPLGAPEGTSGALRFSTDGALLVLGKSTNVRADGATFGALQATHESADYLLQGMTGRLVGLIHGDAVPGYRTNIGFLAGPTGATLDLNLLDVRGTVVAARTAAATLAAEAWTQAPLGLLLPGVAIPDHATLEITVASGMADAYASFIDNGTGDPVVLAPAVPTIPAVPNISAVSPCPARPGVAGLINAGTNLARIDLDPARHPDALCNDGSPGAFFIRKGVGASSDRWVIFLEGGGGCGDATGCQERWCAINTNLGAFKMSNQFLPEHGIAGGGILADREDSLFADFNVLWVHYCSSDSWAGRKRDRVFTLDENGLSYSLHFLGARIFEAVLDELRAGVSYHDTSGQLVTLPSLDDAEVVLLVGESAGGHGAKKHVDRIGRYLAARNRSGQLVYAAVFDASDAPSNDTSELFVSQKQGQWRSEAISKLGRFDESCVALHPNDSWHCVDAAHLAEHHITTPFFVRNDLLDENETSDFGSETWPYGDQLWQFAALEQAHLARLPGIAATAEEKSDVTTAAGVYGPHCDNHTALRDDAKFFRDQVSTSGGNLSFYETLRNWMLRASPSIAIEPSPTADPVPKSVVCTE